ncbi:MAG: succinate--CoA ligase subunit alpha [Proteobacteria bacterium]|nr:succinate--CoA ligase subunit alpha [Pseudomonadota bacterium]
MSILVDKDSRVIVQGLTGREGRFHAERMIEYGSRVVGGVTPGKGGGRVLDLPVFDTVRQAAGATGADVSVIFVPAALAADAILEASEAGVRLVVCITEGIPVLDMVRVKAYLADNATQLIGPNCPGVISPGGCKAGIMPGYIHQPGAIGVISRSGTLTYEVVDQLSGQGLGQSTCIGIGGDPIIGLGFVELLAMFEADPGTEAVVMIGEIGGTGEEEAAEFARDNFSKPLFAFIAGRTAPPGKRMGHAGAIISGRSGHAADKIAALEAAGVSVVSGLATLGAEVKQVLAAG